MKKIIKNNGLTIVLLLLFLTSLVGQFFEGFSTYNDERFYDHLPSMTRAEYIHSGHFISSVAENMESEFLQMALFVYLTMCLYQKGSAESKKPHEERTEEDKNNELKDQMLSYEMKKKKPIVWRLYENSLSLVLISFFIIFFLMHAYGSMKYINTEHLAHHEALISYPEVFKESEFWFESFQNWQSEFFSIAAICVLSIFLRQKGSSQSKKLFDPHWKTGGD